MRQVSEPESGAVAIITGLLIVALLVFTAFAVDVGNAYAQNRQLAVAADAAAVAAAAKVGEQLPPGTSCTPAFASAQTALAKNVADSVNTANNRSLATGQVEPVDSVIVRCVGASGGNPEAIEVEVTNSRSVETFLARVIGINELSPGNSATARFSKSRTVTGLRPWAVCDNTAILAQSSPSETFATGLDNKLGICSKGPTAGNWGSVDYNGGSPNAPDLAVWTRDGYPGPVQIPSNVPADPGVSGSSGLQSAFGTLVGQVVQFPSVTECIGDCQGSTAEFAAVGVLTAKVCGIRYSGSEYTTDASTGALSDCWKDPNTWTKPYAGRTVTGAAVTDKSAIVTTAADAFTPEDAGRTVNIAGAGPAGATLTTTIIAVPDKRSIELADKAAATITPVDVVFPAQNDRVIPLDTNKKPIDHIQFRWVNFSTSSFPGSQPSDFCELDDRLCVGVVQLWR